eukprot:IDg9619t1
MIQRQRLRTLGSAPSVPTTNANSAQGELCASSTNRASPDIVLACSSLSALYYFNTLTIDAEPAPRLGAPWAIPCLITVRVLTTAASKDSPITGSPLVAAFRTGNQIKSAEQTAILAIPLAVLTCSEAQHPLLTERRSDETLVPTSNAPQTWESLLSALEALKCL